MRLLIANYHRTLVGGVETYLAAILPHLAVKNEIHFIHEMEANPQQAWIPLPPGAQVTQASDATEILENWRPDLAFLHAPHNLRFQRQLIEHVPTIAFAHGYFGLCISGTKTWKRFPAHPCGQLFSWKCLLHFHAKSCGGSNPLTMLRNFRRESGQLKILRSCDAVLTHAGPLQSEYLRQGIAANRLFTPPHFVEPPKTASVPFRDHPAARLIFIGRFDLLKGGHLLLKALPQIADRLNRPVHLRMVGSGPAAGHWKEIAQGIAAKNIQIDFPGWLNREQIDSLLAESDLLVVPSIWPEPFGQVGLEAGQLGVPAAAFDVGGISSWLREGINGRLAPADPPKAEGIADAIVKSLENPAHYATLRTGALKIASEHSVEQHVRALMTIFETVLSRRNK